MDGNVGYFNATSLCLWLFFTFIFILGRVTSEQRRVSRQSCQMLLENTGSYFIMDSISLRAIVKPKIRTNLEYFVVSLYLARTFTFEIIK
jgi:hypothetical protein